jgi:ribonuclease HII
MQETTFDKERKLALEGWQFVVGVDEAGRGPLAGPVVACAVALKNQDFGSSTSKIHPPAGGPEEEKLWGLIRDSKKLSEKQREKMFDFIHEHFYVGVGIVSAETIDRVNILQATFLSMKAALSELLRTYKSIHQNSGRGDDVYILVDGNQTIPNCSYTQEAVTGGDGIVKSIAAASIVAKVTRDRMILQYDKEYPGYGLAKHKGYGTQVHMDALRRLGPSPIHRMSFRPVLLALPENVNKRFANVLKPRKLSSRK